MSGPFDLLNRLAPATPRAPGLPDVERKPDPWESAMQATCECLSWRGSLDSLERRQIEDALGESCYADFPVHARPALATAHTLLERGAFSAEELAAKMNLIRARLNRT